MKPATSNAAALDPADYVGIVGSSFAKYDHTAVLTIGSRSWDRIALGRLGAPHPKAAAAVNRVVRELRIRSIPALAAHVHELGAYKGLGVTSYWLVIAILKAHGYDVVKLHAEPVTYATVKARARRATKQARADKRRRRAGPPSESAHVSM